MPPLLDILRQYANLGLISFGGPGVHVVILRKKFVDKLKWLDADTFQDLFTLGNALPGPGSTQLAFSIAVARAGTVGGVLAFLLWSLPGALAMGGLGFGVKSIPPTLPPLVYGLFTGLNAAAVGLIAVAAVQLSRHAITDWLTRLIVLGSASFGICYHAPWMYPVLVAAGGLLTLAWDYRRLVLPRRRSPPASPAAIEMQDIDSKDDAPSTLRQRRPIAALDPEPAPTAPTIITPSPLVAAASGALAILLVVVTVVTRSQLAAPPRPLDFFSNMLLAGIIIFGGGPVVIPLLRQYTVQPGWVSDRDFLLGYAILNAMPGPNFNYAVFLGVLSVPNNPALGAILGYIGIFSPGILLKLSLLPLYRRWRSHEWARSLLRGLNAAASGLVFTAVYALFLVGYIYTSPDGSTGRSGSLTSDPFWAVVSACAFVAGLDFGLQPIFPIAGGALAGLAWQGVQQSHRK